MGWWGVNVMGGDEPLDIQIGLLDSAGISSREMSECDHDIEIFRDRLTDHLDKMVMHARRIADRTGGISMQVLGAIALKADVPISVGLGEEICLAADMDEWAETASDRRLAMREFMMDIRKHASK